MKRSEILDIIEDNVKEYFNLHYHITNREFAIGILTAIEEAGMLPPTDTDSYEGVQKISYNCIWEPEDEEK